MFRDWRQRHVAPPEWVAWELWVYIPGSDLGWWHRPSLIVQSSAQIRTRILAIRENIVVQCILWLLRGNEVAFNCVSSVKCSWSGPLSWLSLLFSIFAARGISKLQEKSVSLQANGEMLGAPVLPHWAHLLTVAAMWNSQPLTKCYQLSPLL